MDCFTPLNKEDLNEPLPSFFTNPFDYEPHNLSKKASFILQQSLQHSTPSHKGKMYGVLVVLDKNKNLGFLSAYSGNEKENNSSIQFVPQVFDITNKNGFFKKGEAELNKINKDIEDLENSDTFKGLKIKLETEQSKAKQAIGCAKYEMAKARAKRDQIRNTTVISDEIKNQLIKESQTEKSNFKKLKITWQNHLNTLNEQVNEYQNKIKHLKLLRKAKSAQLQERLFNQYRFLNKYGDLKSACDIFKATPTKIPPAGAGDCAAPKLLHYAFAMQLQPVAMAEFWWGKSPKAEIRKHGHFYPACKSKCKPILNHMLKGLNTKMVTRYSTSKPIQYIYEDNTIAIINKPGGLLSVPGKDETDSVYSRVKEKYPQATGPLIVHRLDMATSGLMIIAKTKESHENLQKQFLNKTINKRYTALLNGVLKMDKGEINLPIRVDLDNRPRQMVCFKHGKPAITKWKVIERTDTHTKVYFYPVTGRTHQLRVHAAHPMGLNTPIVGDELYGTKADRLKLHAEKIDFIHPLTKEPMSFILTTSCSNKKTQA